jgi:GTP cyclohydrolase I
VTLTPYGQKLVDEAYVEALARELLQSTTGLDVTSPHAERTPARFVAMLRELCTPEEFDFTSFPNDEGVDEMVIVDNIPFYTLCNHHLAPFFGVAHIGYIPNQTIVGLSKFPRAVQNLAKDLNVQENLTIKIADFLEHELDPIGVAVVLRAEHLCMSMRGVKVLGTKTTTSAMRGVFADHDRTAKAEFLAMIGSKL